MLTQFDDYLIHQTPQPVAYVATGDKRFYDRHFFMAFARDGSVGVASGLGVYPNTNVADGFVAVLKDGIQYNIRVSRTLWPDPSESFVGPLTFAVLEPLKKIGISLGGNGADLKLNLSFLGAAPPWEEGHHLHRQDGRLTEDQHRFAQVGSCAGTISLGQHTFELGYDSSFAVRDRSWGIRTGFGGPDIGQSAYGTGYGAVHWIQFGLGERRGYARLRETVNGDVTRFEGCISCAPGDSTVGTKRLARIEHQLKFHPSSRRISGGTLKLVAVDGEEITMRVSDVMPPLNEHGLGYQLGWADGLGHGVPRGASHVEHDVWDARDPAATINRSPTPTTPQNRLFDNLLRLEDTASDSSGNALYVFFAKGGFAPYGFGVGA